MDDFNPLYYNTLDQIYHFRWAQKRLSRLTLLQHSIATLWPNGHPTRLIQVAGTSGKGSVCRFLEAGFNLKVRSGALLSPHLFDFRERFNIVGELASPDDIVELWEGRIMPHALKMAEQGEDYAHHFPELCVLMGLALFEEHDIEWAAVETGVGGRYDQSTALDVIAVAMTNVSDDHMEVLGSELWQRALEKAGVARPGKPFFTSAYDEEARRMIEAVCEHVGAPLTMIDIEAVRATEKCINNLSDLPANHMLIDASHQVWNAALSIPVIQYFYPDLDDVTLLQAFAGIRFPGRFEEIEPGVFIDVAHNPDKVRALVRELSKRMPDSSNTFVVGVSGVRDPGQVLAPLLKVAGRIIITGGFYKGIEAKEVKTALDAINRRGVQIEVVPDPRAAYQMALSLRTEGEAIILTGSTYMIDRAINVDPYVQHINATFGWRKLPPGWEFKG